jgi:hypothetical protein
MKYFRQIIGLLVISSVVLILAVAGLGVTAASAGDSTATGVNVSLNPANQTVDPGEEVTYDIVVDGATEGVSGYSMTVELGDAAVATVEAFEHANDPMFDNTEVTNDSVEVSAGMGTNPIDGAAEIILGTITLIGEDDGETPVAFVGGANETDISNQSNNQYDVLSTTGGTLAVDRPEVDVSLTPAEQTAGVGEEATYEVVVEGATEGISAYAMTIDVANSSVAGVDGFEHANDPMFDDTQVSNGTVEVNAAMGNNAIEPSNETVLGTLTVSGESTGTTEIEINQSSVDIALDNENVSGYGVGAVTGGSLDVSQQAAGVELVAPGPVTTGNVTLDVVVTGAENGIAGYDLSVDSGSQPITFVDYELTQPAQFDNSGIAENGSTLSLEAALGENTLDPTEEVQIATATVNIDVTGTFTLGFEEAAVLGTDSNEYAVTGEKLSLSVDPGPPTVPGGQGPPQNLGITPNTYEDVNGDGEFNIFDVQTLFTSFNTPPVQNNPAAFNFDGDADNEVTIFDVQALFSIV